jgi:hypothetical protein
MSEPGRKDFTTSMFETRFYASRLLVSSESSRLHIARYIFLESLADVYVIFRRS